MKTAKIKINASLDFYSLDADQNGKGFSTISRFPISGLTDKKKSNILIHVKAALYDETWRLTEIGYKVEVIPYIN